MTFQFFTGDELIITDDNYTDALPDMKFTYRTVRNRIVPFLEDITNETIFCVNRIYWPE